MAQDRVRWPAVVNRATNLGNSTKDGMFIDDLSGSTEFLG
jgi:hypothetical protein